MSSSTRSSGTIEISKAMIGCMGAVLAAIIGGIFLLISTGIIEVNSSAPVVRTASPLTNAPRSVVALELVREEDLKASEKSFSVSLDDAGIVVGQGWEFTDKTSGNKLYSGCVAYLLVGPGKFNFAVNDGRWRQYKNATAADASSLLEGQKDSLITQGCSTNPKVVRLP